MRFSGRASRSEETVSFLVRFEPLPLLLSVNEKVLTLSLVSGIVEEGSKWLEQRTNSSPSLGIAPRFLFPLWICPLLASLGLWRCHENDNAREPGEYSRWIMQYIRGLITLKEKKTIAVVYCEAGRRGL